jgi:hypothetical protein
MSGEADAQVLAEARQRRRRLAETVAGLSEAHLNTNIQWQGTDAPLFSILAVPSEYQRPRRQIRRILAAQNWDAPAAIRHLQWAAIARARLEASLVGVQDDLLDMHPFTGEWSVRQQLAHVELTDIRYTIATQYAVRRNDDEPLAAPPEAYPPREDNPPGNLGETLADILARMRRVRSDAITPLLGITAADLLRSTEWHTAEHTVGFRLHRFGQHDLELATDIQRTLSAAGFRPTPAMELAGSLVEGWGELESALLGVPAAVYDTRPATGGQSLADVLRELATGDRECADRARLAAV